MRTTRSDGSPTYLKHFLDTFLIHNIVLVQAIGLCPIVAVAVRLQYGVVLTVCTAAVLLPTSLYMSLLGNRMPAWLRPPVYTLGASVLLLGAAVVVDRYLSHEIYAALYLFLPLMAVNTLFTYRAGSFSVTNPPLTALVDAAGSSLGFGLVICTVAAVREIAVYNTLWNIPLDLSWDFPATAQPFFGFLLLGLMAAGLQWLKAALSRRLQHKGEGV